jgi:hypothetical protein
MRLECRDQGRTGDHGGSRGRARAWSAVIKVGRVITEDRAGRSRDRDAVIKEQFMIMESRAGDRLGCQPLRLDGCGQRVSPGVARGAQKKVAAQGAGSHHIAVDKAARAPGESSVIMPAAASPPSLVPPR